jgi:peptide/nickel transport system permease protein
MASRTRESDWPLGKAPATRHDGAARQTWRRFRRHRLATVGLVLFVIVVAAAILAPVLGRHDPLRVDLSAVRQPPSPEHWLGGDLSGRDVWSRVLHGLRTSLLVGFGAVALYVVIGSVIGLVAGYYGGAVDHTLMRIIDAVLSMPLLILVIAFIALIGSGLTSVILVIGFLGWPATARLVRGQVLWLRESEFVSATRVLGLTDRAILVRHILPNVVGPLTVVVTFGVGAAILLEASLGFLGLGVQPPTPTLGEMILEARDPEVLRTVPWLWLPPGILIAVTVLAVNLVGEGLRDALDPRGSAKRWR